MTTYNTGNPLGSTDPRDLFDNAQNTDDAVNGDGKTWVDRFGRTRVSMKGVEEAVPDAIAARNTAESARDAAVLARDAAIATAGPLYATEAEGRAAVADGKTFSVQGSGSVAARVFRRINAATSEFLTEIPSAEAYTDSIIASAVQRSGLSEFHNDDDSDNFSFVFIAEGGNIAVGLNFSGGLESVVKGSDDRSGQEFHNDDVVLFKNVSTDSSGNILSAWDDQGNTKVTGGGEPEPASMFVKAPLVPFMDGNALKAIGAKIKQHVFDEPPIAVFPGNENYVRAAVNWPQIDDVRNVAVVPDKNLLIPDADGVLHVFIGIGQSLIIGANSESTLVSTEPVWPDDVMMFESSIYSDIRMGNVTDSGTPSAALDPGTLTGFIPLIAKPSRAGPRGETPIETLANSLSVEARKFGTRFKSLSFTAGVGGSSYSQLKKGSQIYENMLIALNKAKAIAAANGMLIVVDACVVKHGEADSGSLTYKNDLIEWRNNIDADVKAITDQKVDVHFVMSQPSSFTTSTPRAALAMLDLHNEDYRFHLACADYSIGASKWYSDYLHMKGNGYAHIGAYMSEAWKKSLWRGASAKNKILQMTAAVRVGNKVTLTHDVPSPPIVLDVDAVAAEIGYGFRFFANNSEIAIDSVNVVSGKVELTLSAVPSIGPERVDYAIRTQTNPRTESAICRGNLRDSSDLVSIHGDKLYNWGVHQSITL